MMTGFLKDLRGLTEAFVFMERKFLVMGRKIQAGDKLRQVLTSFAVDFAA